MTKKKAVKKNRGAKWTPTTGKSVTPSVERQLVEGQRRLDKKTEQLKEKARKQPIPPAPLSPLPGPGVRIPMEADWLAAFGSPKNMTSRRFAAAFEQLLAIFQHDEAAFLLAQMKCMEAHWMLIGVTGTPGEKSAAAQTMLQMHEVFKKLDEIREILQKQ